MVVGPTMKPSNIAIKSDCKEKLDPFVAIRPDVAGVRRKHVEAEPEEGVPITFAPPSRRFHAKPATMILTKRK